MNTIALAVPVVVGLELLAALGLAWLCWRLAKRRNLHALRDIARAFIALGLSALVQLFDFGGFSATDVALLDLGRSLAVWLYLGFMVLGATGLATENFVSRKARRDAILGSVLAALLTTAISLVAGQDAFAQEMVRNALRAGGTAVACLMIALVIAKAPAPPTMVLGASVVRVALTLVTIMALLRAGISLLSIPAPLTGAEEWQPLLTVDFIAQCALCVGLVIWILDRDWALAHDLATSAELRASSDALTGLPNRTILMDRLEMAVAAAMRSGTHVGVLYIDLDDFKAVNDQHGHLAGDAVLRTVGERLTHQLRGSDTVARFGGDEFVVLSPFMHQPCDLDVVVTKVREALRHSMMHDGISIAFDGSVGAALFPRDGSAATALLTVADSAMYRDKDLRRRLRHGLVRPTSQIA